MVMRPLRNSIVDCAKMTSRSMMGPVIGVTRPRQGMPRYALCMRRRPSALGRIASVRSGHRAFQIRCASSGCFDTLADLTGSEANDLQLREGDNGRGIFAERAFRPGDTVLSIPLSSCFIVGRESGLSLPGASIQELSAGKLADWPLLQAATSGVNGETFRDLGWDLRLALAVADMRINTERLGTGSSSSGTERPAVEKKAGLLGMIPGLGKKMRRKEPAPASEWLPMYSELLPAHHPSPICFPPELLPLLQDKDLAELAAAEQERFARVLEDPGMAAALGGALPSQIYAWALGMARSRAFDATPGTFVMAPVLDMVNHAWQAPNAEVQLRLSGTGASADETVFMLQGEVAVAAVKAIPKVVLCEIALMPPPWPCAMAIQPVLQGSEVLFSYGCNYMPTSDLFLRYGMMRPKGNPNDLLPLADLLCQHLGVAEEPDEQQQDVCDESNNPEEAAAEEEEVGAMPSALIDMQLLEASLKAAVEREGGRWLQARANDGELLAVISSLEALSEQRLWPTPEQPSMLDLRDAISKHIEACEAVSKRENQILSDSSGTDPADVAAVNTYGSKQKALWDKALWAVESLMAYTDA